MTVVVRGAEVHPLSPPATYGTVTSKGQNPACSSSLVN